MLLLVTSQQRSSPKIGKKRDNVIVCFFFGKQIGKITVSFLDTHVYFHWLTAKNTFTYIYLDTEDESLDWPTHFLRLDVCQSSNNNYD